MNEKTIRILEFDAIRARVADCALSEEAKTGLLSEMPLVEEAAIRERKRVVAEIAARMRSGDEEKQESLPDIGFLLPKLAVEGAALEIDEAFALGLFVERGQTLKRWLSPESETAQANRPGRGAVSVPNAAAAHPAPSPYAVSVPAAARPSLSPHTVSVPAVLRPLAASVPDCSAVSRAVFRVLNKDGSLRDLPEFQEINRRIRSLSAELDAVMAKYTRGEDAGLLQSRLPSERDGRAVLAVKANYRGRVKGIVHEVSGTGQTLFIEPEEVVEKNNDILIEKRRLDAEILRVLREMTASVAENREALAEFHEKIIGLETLRAKARYSREIKGVFARDAVEPDKIGNRAAPANTANSDAAGRAANAGNPTNIGSPANGDSAAPASASLFGNNAPSAETDLPFCLKQARHPLLGRAAVPIDFAMGADTRTVIITGPNTGGKTVALKTAGLFALMNQAGLALPCAEGTTLPFFNDVFADIGDEQSISQSLSTFSGHMTNIASIAQAATDKSLVLLDELGSGTDPEEGSAIAMAILDHLIEKRARLIVTTHHSVLKNYGYTRETVENASVEFDSRTLSPTYRIILGIPGESRAIDIAARNGLSPAIIKTSRSYLDEERSDVSALIAGLKQKHRDLDEETRKWRLEEKRLLEDRRTMDLKELRLKQKEAEIKSGGLGKLKSLLAESRKTLENLVRELKEGEITREKTLKVKEFLNDLAKTVADEEAAFDDERKPLQKRAADAARADAARTDTARDERAGAGWADAAWGGDPAAGAGGAALDIGAEVMVASYKQRGTIIRQDKKDSWIVEIGSLRMTFPEDELTPVKPAHKPLKPAMVITDLAPQTEAALEINLLGMRLEEAIDALRRQLDAAALSGLAGFAVVHGKGNGILRQGVHDYLSRDPHVASFHFSRPEMGGAGRTEVELKQ
jgi:DNA mismatch repair protein MutS2